MVQNAVAIGSIFTAQYMSYELQRKSIRKTHSEAKNHLKMRLHVYSTCSYVPWKAPVFFLFRGFGKFSSPGLSEDGRTLIRAVMEFVRVYFHTEYIHFIAIRKQGSNIFVGNDSQKCVFCYDYGNLLLQLSE
jgi:hypothetical protein